MAMTAMTSNNMTQQATFSYVLNLRLAMQCKHRFIKVLSEPVEMPARRCTKAWSAYALYARKNGWNLSLAGLAISIGCGGRLIVQQDARLQTFTSGKLQSPFGIIRRTLWQVSCFVSGLQGIW